MAAKKENIFIVLPGSYEYDVNGFRYDSIFSLFKLNVGFDPVATIAPVFASITENVNQSISLSLLIAAIPSSTNI